MISLRGLPLCAECEDELIDHGARLKAVKEKWDKMPDVDSGPTAVSAFIDAVGKAVSTSKSAIPAQPCPARFNIGELRATTMRTAAYVATYGSIKSKGMRRETMELWERLQLLPMDQCIVIDVPEGKEAFKLRASLSNTIQRLIRINKPPYRISIGANNLKKLVVIAKEASAALTTTRTA